MRRSARNHQIDDKRTEWTHISSTRSVHCILRHLPLAVTEVVHKALAKDPLQRFTSVSDFAQALSQTAKNATPINLASTSAPERLPSFLITTASESPSRQHATRTMPTDPAILDPTQPPATPPSIPLTMTQPASVSPAHRPTPTRKILRLGYGGKG